MRLKPQSLQFWRRRKFVRRISAETRAPRKWGRRLQSGFREVELALGRSVKTSSSPEGRADSNEVEPNRFQHFSSTGPDSAWPSRTGGNRHRLSDRAPGPQCHVTGPAKQNSRYSG